MYDHLQQQLKEWTKIADGSEGKAARARWGMKVLRRFVEQTCDTLSLSNEERKLLSAALNALGDRCATADALERK